MSETELVGHALTPVAFGKHFRWTATGLDVVGQPSLTVTAAFGEQVRTLEVSLPFVVGDYLNYLDDRFPQEASQIVADCGWSFETARNYRWVARSVARENRMTHLGLGIRHHQAVAKLPAPQQKKWLTRALGSSNGDAPVTHWPVARLKAEIRSGGRLEVTGWYVHVTCASAKEREKIVTLLEREGVTVRTFERREVVG